MNATKKLVSVPVIATMVVDSVIPVLQVKTGQCTCYSNYAGRQCDSCTPGKKLVSVPVIATIVADSVIPVLQVRNWSVYLLK